jgi:hypothetical protein
MKPLHLSLAILLLFLAACSQPATQAPTPTNTPIPTETPAPTPVPSVSLTYEDNAQVELVTSAGRHIYIDVYNVGMLTKPPSADDVLLTTHKHFDHYYADFQSSFPGKQLFTQTGKIEFPDVTITGIASAHNSNDPVLEVNSNNYIYLIEVAGQRIAHFGDIGQEALSDSQLAALGTVDLAITQFANSFSSMDSTNLKGFNLMDQVKPRLVIPTHSDKATIQLACQRWKGYFSEARTVTLSSTNIPTEPSILILGTLGAAYGAIYQLEPWK